MSFHRTLLRASLSISISSPSTSVIRFFHITTQSGIRIVRFPYNNIHRPVHDPAKQDPFYFENKADELPLGDDYIDGLKTLWDDKIRSQRALVMKATDYLIDNNTDYGLPKIDESSPRVEYSQVDELATAPDAVRRIFSIGYGERSDLTTAWKKAMVEQVSPHVLARDSLQFKIAWVTACIRHLTALADQLMDRPPKRTGKKHPKPKKLLQTIHQMIQHRRKMLRFLREENKEEFERIITELRIAYYVEKTPEVLKTRKSWSEAQLVRRAELERNKMLDELHKKLEIGREERAAKIESELVDLAKEKKQIEQRLAEINEIEGLSMRGVVGVYQPKYNEEYAEISNHGLYFGFPPSKKPTW